MSSARRSQLRSHLGPMDAMGAPEKTRLPVRPSLNPWSTTERKWYLASLPSDGVIEHRAIIAPRTPAARAPPGKGGAGRGGACGVVDDSSKLGVRRSGARGRRCCLSEGQAPLLGGIRPGSGAAVSTRSSAPTGGGSSACDGWVGHCGRAREEAKDGAHSGEHESVRPCGKPAGI